MTKRTKKKKPLTPFSHTQESHKYTKTENIICTQWTCKIKQIDSKFKNKKYKRF